MTLLALVGFAVLGLVVGVLGTLIGAGGGFILLPVLAFLDPAEPAAALTAISLSVVLANAASGSLAYARLRRIDYRSALTFAAASLPGTAAGAWATHLVDRGVFDPALGALLVGVGLFIFFRPAQRAALAATHPTRSLTERDGTVHRYSPRLALGVALSAGIGLLSGFLGIGGGIIHVPAMVYLLGFPTHVATATSHLTLALGAAAGVAVHLADGSLVPTLARVVPLAAGALVGAQLGARLSSRLQARWILRGLAVALASVGVRLLVAR